MNTTLTKILEPIKFIADEFNYKKDLDYKELHSKNSLGHKYLLCFVKHSIRGNTYGLVAGTALTAITNEPLFLYTLPPIGKAADMIQFYVRATRLENNK